MVGTKKTALLKWILLLTFSRVSAYVVVKFENLKEKQLPEQLPVLDVLKDSNDENNLGLRRSNDVNYYMNRKLVKRVIPHGYEIKHLEYDEKYKTLYKPLVRIHKRKPALDSSNSDENEKRYDLMFVLNDEYYKNVVDLAKDDSLMEPFAIDSADIKYLPSGNGFEDIINEKKGNYGYDYLKPTRYKLVDHSEPLNGQVNQNEEEDAYENDNYLKLLGLLKKSLRKYSDDVENNLMPLHSNKINLADEIDGLNRNLDKGEGAVKKHNSNKLTEPGKLKKPLWFGPIGYFNSNNFKVKNNKLEELDAIRSYGYENSPSTNINDVIDSIKQLIQKRNEIQSKQQKKESSDHYDPYRWFGPLGKFSRELTERETSKFVNTLEKPKTYNHDQIQKFKNDNNPKQDMSNFVNSLKQLIETQTEREHFMESNGNKELGSIGHNEKKYKHNAIVLKDGKSIAFELNNFYRSLGDKIKLNEKDVKNVATSNMFKQSNKILKDTRLENEEERHSLRLKSGEDDAPTPMVPWGKDESTTDANVLWKPQYPFWNYWTYDKTIHLDDCKGNLIQHGRLCIEPAP